MRAVSMLLLVLAVSACQTVTEPEVVGGTTDPSRLVETRWRLVRFSDGTGPPAGAAAKLTVRFSADGRIGGAAGPNGYGGFYSATEIGAIELREIVSTLIGGPEAGRAARYLYGLSRAHSYRVSATELRVEFGRKGFLHFEPEL